MRLFRGNPIPRTGWVVIGVVVCVLSVFNTSAACIGCTNFSAGMNWGTASIEDDELGEASGLAVSSKNPGIVWSHNDDGGASLKIFAFRTNGLGVARYRLSNVNVQDVEDMAVGPGPTAGTSYLYIGDIGGEFGRNEVKIIRVPEPTVFPVNQTVELGGAQVFTLKYTNFLFWDAETLMVDPLNGDVYVGTKHDSVCRFYRVNLNDALPGSTNLLEFVIDVPFPQASGGTISADGFQIALRTEFFAQIWLRCEGESIATALARTGRSIPVSFFEPNGEAIAFLPNGRGYLTISDKPQGGNATPAPLYFFAATCPPTLITQNPQSLQVPVGDNAMFVSHASGENLHYQWRFNGQDIAGETTDTLFITNVQPANSGQYSLRAVGNGGSAISSDAVLSIQMLPPVIGSQPPLNTLAPTGSTVQLTAGVAGTPPLHYSWSFGRKLLAQNSPTLTLTNVQRANSGKYRVTVTNSVGKAISDYATLKVLNPPVIAGQPLSRTNAINSTATLRVRAKGSPRLGYQWFHDGVAVSNGTRAALSLRRVQPAQSGQYHVVITNSVGSVTSAPTILTVQ
jgi:hypothetical protein